MSKNSLKQLYFNHIKPMLENNPELQENLCEDCMPESPSPYSLDTATCSKCGKTKECTNTFIYNIVKVCKFSPEKDWYGKVPRVYKEITMYSKNNTRTSAIEHFSTISNKFENLWMFSKEYESKMLLNIINLMNFSINDKFVDIGGGNGSYTEKITKIAKLCNEPICVEPSALADIARDKNSIFVYKEDAMSFAKRDKKYDKILMKEVIHHIGDRNTFFSKIKKNISQNGTLLIVTRPQHPPLPFFKKQKDLFAQGQPHYDEIAKELINSGFTVKVKNDFFTFDMDKERWFTLIRERFMSDLSKLSDDEIEDGIKELSEIFQDDKKITITDEIIYMIANPKIGGEMVRNGMRQIVEMK